MLDTIRKNQFEILYALLALLLICALSYFYSPLLERADTVFHYNRLSLVIDALRNGAYPIYMDYGSINRYGYLTNAFYPDLILLPFAIVGLFTSLKTSFLTLIFITSVCTFYFTYTCVKCIFKSKYIGYIAALLYTFCLYRIFDVYYRGAMAEYMAFTFLPIVLLGIYQISNGNYHKWYIFTIGCFLLLNTHLITTAMVGLAVVIYIVINCKQYIHQRKRIKYLAISIFATVLLSLGFLVPFAEQLLSNQFYFSTQPATDIKYSLLTMNKILEGLLNTVYSANELPQAKLGGMLFFLLFARLFIRCRYNKIKYIDIAVILAFGLIFSANYYFPWTYFPFKYMQFIQHPVRLLMIASFILSIACSYYIAHVTIKSKYKKWVLLILIGVTFLIIKTNGSNYYEIFKISGTIGNHVEKGLSIGGAEYLPSRITSVDDLWKTPRKLVYNKENIKITNIDLSEAKASFDVVNLSTKDSIIIPFTYYKGYQISSNGKDLEYVQSEKGLIKIDVDKQSTIQMSYIGTTLQKTSNYLALLFILIFVVFVSIKTLKYKKNE